MGRLNAEARAGRFDSPESVPCNATCGTVLRQIPAALRNKYRRLQTAACSVWCVGVHNTNRLEGYAHLRSTQDPSLT